MKVGRNDPCPCGSGKKYKHCCYEKDSVKHEGLIIEAEVSESETTDDDADSEQQDEKTHAHGKDRSRFKGQVRGKSAAFNPRAARGGQRGA